MPKSPVRSPFNCPRWTESQAREVIAALARSGKSVNAFAADHGLDPQRVHLWRRAGRRRRRYQLSRDRCSPFGSGVGR